MIKEIKKAIRKKSPRYGIAEWYGEDIVAMPEERRVHFGKVASEQSKEGILEDAPVCPFLSTLSPGAKCNKAGGVCSIRRFDIDENGAGTVLPNDRVVTVCPSRFLQNGADEKSILLFVASKMLDVDSAALVKETPFLRKLESSFTKAAAKNHNADSEPDNTEDEDAEEENAKKAGRIDWILADTESKAQDLKWCAVEMQSLYFSGGEMGSEFDAYANGDGSLIFPTKYRRPDYRSSGPKRLAPQLSVKVPVMLRWGNKVAVVVDRYFYENMSDLQESDAHAKSETSKRDNAEVIWFIVDYCDDMKLQIHKTIYTNLDHSVSALNATAPIEKRQFNKELRDIINDNAKLGKKVFKIGKPKAHE